MKKNLVIPILFSAGALTSILCFSSSMNSKPDSLIEPEVVLMSLTSKGSISLSGEGLPSMILGQSNKEVESELEAVGCHCFGHVDNGDCHATGAIGSQYNTYCNVNRQSHKDDCCGRVKGAIAALTTAQKQSIANCLCASNKAAGPVFAYYGIGTHPYEQCDNKIGTLIRPAAYSVTTCTCPPGWAANPSNIVGGITTDGKCKKVACQPMGISPFPANGTAVGTWGFTWGDALIAWGTQANGGAPNCVTVNYPPGPCSFTWQ